MLEDQINTLQDIYHRRPPEGVCFSKFKADCLKECFPPVGPTDFDVGCPCPENFVPGPVGPDSLAWLVGGNEGGQLGEVPLDGFFDMGIDVRDGPLATAGVDIITAGDARIRIFGDAADQPPEYQEGMEGRVVIANGFIENRDIPALFAPLEPAAVQASPPVVDSDVLPPIADVYLERPSNAYNLIIPNDFGVFIPESPAITLSPIFQGAAGNRVVFINNIFLGDRPVTAPTIYDGTYTQANVTPTTGLTLGVNTFDYLLKVFNPVIPGASPIALFFDLGATTVSPPGGGPTISTGSRFTPIYSTLSAAPYIIPAGGAAFFTMRVESGTTHVMLDNVIYPNYVEP